MKKRLTLIGFLVVMVLLSVTLGFTVAPQMIETVKDVKTKHVAGEITKNNEENLVVLSQEDKAVKAEIAKHYDTKIDFRFQKHEKFNGETYDLKFSKMGCITSSDILSNVTYKSDNGDEVSYDLETGNITMAYFRSKETSKTPNSIDIVKAESIAYDYASKKCDIKQYVIEEKEERDNGYMFSYCKYIYGYRTNDRVRVLIGFDGSVVWTTIRFYAIDENNLKTDKKWFEDQIGELEKPNYDTIIEDIWIERDEDKVYFCIKNKKISIIDYSVSASVSRFEIPH